MTVRPAFRYRTVIRKGTPLAATWLATVAVIALAGIGQLTWAAAAAVLVAAWIWLGRTRAHRSPEFGARAAVLATLTLTAAAASPVPLLAAGVGAALLVAVMAEPSVSGLLEPRLTAFRLNVPRTALSRLREPLFHGSCGGVVILAAGTAGVPGAIWIPLGVLWLAAMLAASALLLVRNRRHLPEHEVHGALTEYGVDYYLYFSGRPEGAYQLQMWLPYLARAQRRGVLLIRERMFLPRALEITDLPIVLAESVESLEYVLSTGRAAFYVNNAAKNADGVRHRQVRHVHLGHGDSEKPASYAATTSMFDQIFVAGQAGVDRFAQHQVVVAREKFALVGRPQVENIDVAATSTRPERPIVLYAPTWRGVLADMQLSSLDAGLAIVRALHEAGARVMFRPHPFSDRDAASRMLITQIDEELATHPDAGHLSSHDTAPLSIFECMNQSELLLTDVSSVASDYLYSNKPFALTYRGDAEEVRSSYPIARAAELVELGTGLQTSISEWLSTDRFADQRAEVRRYYLGPWAAEGYAEVFVEAVRRAIDLGPLEHPGAHGE